MKESQSSLTNINPLTIFLLCYPIDTLLALQSKNLKLIPACSMQLYSFFFFFFARYLYAPYFGIYLQDVQNRPIEAPAKI